jgi:hypothetical protein
MALTKTNYINNALSLNQQKLVMGDTWFFGFDTIVRYQSDTMNFGRYRYQNRYRYSIFSIY